MRPLRHRAPKGAGSLGPDGYRRYMIDGRNRLEHHLVIEAYLGRRLRRGEVVHHRNGVRDDNRLANLELWSTAHPPGQRVADKVAWAKELLRTYEPEALADPANLYLAS